MYFPLLLNHNFLDRNLLNFFRIYIHHNFINRDKTSKRNKHSRKVKFIRLDHECAGARKLGLEQILAHLRAEKAFADVPVILSGDFNAEPDSEEMKPLRETAGLVNATEGIGITFHNYHRDDPNDPQCSIDYIILKGDWELKKVEKWTEQKDGVCLSDHYPICAELI